MFKGSLAMFGSRNITKSPNQHPRDKPFGKDYRAKLEINGITGDIKLQADPVQQRKEGGHDFRPTSSQ